VKFGFNIAKEAYERGYIEEEEKEVEDDDGA